MKKYSNLLKSRRSGPHQNNEESCSVSEKFARKENRKDMKFGSVSSLSKE